MPLPANCVVADALSPFELANPDEGGCCRSKYWRDFTEEKLLQHVASSSYWKDHKEDTIFLDIASNGETVSFEDCRVTVIERQQPESEQTSRRGSRSGPSGKDAAECAQSLQELERALAAAKAKQAEMMSRLEKRKRQNDQRSPSQEERPNKEASAIKVEHTSPSHRPTLQASRSSQPDEKKNVLASLGVTGPAKPAKQGSRVASHSSPSNSESPAIGRATPKLDANGTAHRALRHPLPNPPPQAKLHRSHTEIGISTAAAVDQQSHTIDHAENGSAHSVPHTEARQNAFRRSSDHSGSRKRYYSSSSDESDTPRRQEDDVTPKLKRRQPKVAEAYR